MKKYTKPSLKELGLLRLVTKFSSSCDGIEVNGVCYHIG
jgi:hypothetical protein